MKLVKITFIIALIGILMLSLLAQSKPIQTGIVKSINRNEDIITIHLENNPVELIIFDTSFINLKKGDTIEFQGRQDIYRNKTQIIVDKIKLIRD